MSAPTPGVPASPGRDASWFGHPRGLSTLFFLEMWERFSYYGMRAFLILYMVHALAFPDARAGNVYGNYTFSAWGAAILGGIVADRWLGQYRSVLFGGIIIALGHFTLAFHPLPFFYAGLSLIVIGTGLLKPNVSGIVGALYETADERRDAGFSIFYMGINSGAFLGPIIAGYLAQKVDWHIGFLCAGVGMTLGLIQFVLHRDRLRPAIERLARRPKPVAVAASEPAGEKTIWGLTRVEWMRIGAMAFFFIGAAIFWGAYEQAGSSLNLFGDRYTTLTILGYQFPSSWYVSVQAIFVILLAPCFAWLWIKLGKYEPSTPTKFAFGLLFVGLSFLFLLPAAYAIHATPGLRVSPFWLVGCYFIQELAELSISPVGLSVFTKLSPVKIVGMMLGVWFLADAIGNKAAGFAAGFISNAPMQELFLTVAAVCIGASVISFALVPPVKQLMGGVH